LYLLEPVNAFHINFVSYVVPCHILFETPNDDTWQNEIPSGIVVNKQVDEVQQQMISLECTPLSGGIAWTVQAAWGWMELLMV
jgi:hypothetical protein